MSRDTLTPMERYISEGFLQQETQESHVELQRKIFDLKLVVAATGLKNAPVFSDYFFELSKRDYSTLSREDSEALLEKVKRTIIRLTEHNKPKFPGQLSQRCCELLVEFGEKEVPLPLIKDDKQLKAMSNNNMGGFLRGGRRRGRTKKVHALFKACLNHQVAWGDWYRTINQWLEAKKEEKGDDVAEKSTRYFAMLFFLWYAVQQSQKTEAAQQVSMAAQQVSMALPRFFDEEDPDFEQDQGFSLNRH